ncbi:MAG TPA: hypothetical protein VHC47_11670, partial [Mucilaginibacter sp.]|nr:hypothetical protein [Mucilaginibacter sp.]
YGLYNCRSDYILHLDSDIFLGGLSQTWVEEALQLLATDPSLLTCSPLPGPPHPDKILIGQNRAVKLNDDYCFEFKVMSTRAFLIDKRFFGKEKIGQKLPSALKMVKARIMGNPPYNLPEELLSDYIKKNGLKRIDFLGRGNGLWTLHPPFRVVGFYERLPEIIKDIEQNNLPPEQYGFYDIVDEVCNWTEAREKISSNSWKTKLIHAKSHK